MDQHHEHGIEMYKEYGGPGLGQIQLVWFKTNKWLLDSIKLNTKYILFGKINDFKGIKSIPHPRMVDNFFIYHSL